MRALVMEKEGDTLNLFYPHVPDFVDVGERVRVACLFQNVDDLLRLPEVTCFAGEPGFKHFALDDNWLMAIYSRKWLPVGRIYKPDLVDLPAVKKVTSYK